MNADATASTNNTHTENPFAPQHCPDCGYSLTGLPAAGRCPECGAPYDDGMIVIYGYGAGTRANAANRRVSEAKWLRVATYVMPVVAFVYLWFTSAGPRMVMIFFSFLLMTTAYAWWRRRGITSPRPVQLRLLPEGFAQRDGFGTVKLTPWASRGLWMRLHRTRPDSFEFDAERRWVLLLTGTTRAGIEFQVTSDGAERIARQIEAWIKNGSDKARFRFEPEMPWWRRYLW